MKRSNRLRTFLLVGSLFSAGHIMPALFAGECKLRLSMINHNRYVYQTDEECDWFHSATWGNWGVSSNVGSKQDGDQFQGWYPDWGRLQWNSCSVDYAHPDVDCRRLNFPAPATEYPYPADGYPFSDSYPWNDHVPPYGTASCVDQYSPSGYNTYGGAEISYPVPDPVDSNCDGLADAGGCLALNGQRVTIQNNYLSVYELDLPDADDLIQTLYFPEVSVNLNCNTDACWAVGDNNYDGWLDDVGNPLSLAYRWPSAYQNDQGLISYPTEPGVPAKRIDATVRIGYVFGTYNGYPATTNEPPALTSGISLSPLAPYQVGQTITAQFSLANPGCTAITFDLLTLGGRDPDQAVADFTHQSSIVLNPKASYSYQGSLTLNKVGSYHFFVAYRTPDGVWQTNLPTHGGAIGIIDVVVSPLSMGTISATPTTCTLVSGSNTCTSTISWSSQNVNAAEVWVQDIGIGSSASLFAGGTSGSIAAPWIQAPPHLYVFTLYDTSFGSRIQLAQARVTASSVAASSISARPIGPFFPFPLGQITHAQPAIAARVAGVFSPNCARRQAALYTLIFLIAAFGVLRLYRRKATLVEGPAGIVQALRSGLAGSSTKLLLLTAVCMSALTAHSYGASRIFGKVISRETGKPLLGEIAIVGSSHGNIFLKHVRASEQGDFEIDRLSAGDLHLTTKLEGFAAEHLSLSLQEGEARYVEFALNKGKTIRGHIHDSSGNPLGGASVSIAYAQGVSERRSIKAAYQWERGETKTGNLGKFEIKDVHPEKQFIVVVSHPDFLSAVSAPQHIQPEESVRLLRLSLHKGIPVMGEIKDEDGNSVQDAQVRLIGTERRLDLSTFTTFELPRTSRLLTVTGTPGTFVFNQVTQAKMVLTVVHPKYRPFRQTIDLTGHQAPFSIKITLKGRN